MHNATSRYEKPEPRLHRKDTENKPGQSQKNNLVSSFRLSIPDTERIKCAARDQVSKQRSLKRQV